MALSDKKKTEMMKRIMIKRIENIGSKAVLINLFKNLSWTKIKNFLDQELQALADQRDINSQKELDEKTDILALKAEKDTY